MQVVTLSLVGGGKLSGKDWISNSLGLPDGSVRALIAFLFLFLVILAATGHINLAELPSWATGIVGTVVGFYFGAQTVSSALQQKTTASIATASLPDGQVGTDYPGKLTAIGLTAPLSWTYKGNLPEGLSLDPATGAITGSPTTETPAVTVTFLVTDSVGNSASRDLAISIKKKGN